MQGNFYGAFQGKKRDILPLLSKLGEDRDNRDSINRLIFHDAVLPDNWTEMGDEEWVKIQFSSGGSMNINYLEGGLFTELGVYMLYVEGFTCTFAMDYGNARTYTYSPYGALEILSSQMKQDMQNAAKEFEKATGQTSVTNDKQDWTDSYKGNAARFIANEVLPPAAGQEGTSFLIQKGVLVQYTGSGAEEVIIPDTCTRIGSRAFQRHKEIKRVVIPGSVKSIGESAFQACKALEQAGLEQGKKRRPLTGAQWRKLWQLSDNKDGTYTAKKYKGQFSYAILPEMIGKYKVAGVRDIGRKYDIGFLRSLTLPAGITSIRICFENMPQLERIEVSEDNPRYSSRDGILFNKAGDTLLRCPCGWKGKGMYIVPEKVKKIEGYAFAECENLTEIRLPEGLETIELCTFTAAEISHES